MPIMEVLTFVSTYIAEVIGIGALIGILMFVVKYSRNSNWKRTRPGRSVMYLARALVATFFLLIFWSFVDEPMHLRWVAEVIVYSPLAWACWYMYFSLLESLQQKPPFVFLVSRKDRHKNKKDISNTMKTNNDKIVAYIRVAVPSAIGYFLAWLIGKIPAVADVLAAIDQQLAMAEFLGWTAEGILSALAISLVLTLYYIVVREAGERWPWVEKLLMGSSKHPVYFVPKEAEVVSDAVPEPALREAVQTAGDSVIVTEGEPEK